MQAIILLLNAIFAKLTTAVNKAFEKSQRGSLVFDVDGANADYLQSVLNAVGADGATIADKINALQRGDGLYSVSLQIYLGGILDYSSKFMDGIGTGSTVIVQKTGNLFTVVSYTNSLGAIITIAAADATTKAATAKSEAIAAAALDATAKAATAKSEAIAAAALDATAKAATARDEAITFADEVASNAALDASAKANAAKSEAIAAAASDATTKANNAKNQAITEAGLLATTAKNQAIETASLDATQKAAGAEANAILAAAEDATTKANAAQQAAAQDASLKTQQAIMTASQDAATKAANAEANAIQAAILSAQEAQISAQNNAAIYTDEAKTAAIGDAKIYTDAEIAKLQQYASIGIKSFKTFEGLVSAGPTANTETIANLPSYVAFGIPTTETGSHIIQVTGLNADGSIVDDKEFTMVVPTGVDANGDATTTTIQVSTNDKLIVELYKLADGSFFMKYVQKYDDRLMEVVKQLIVKIDTQVSESELLNAVTDVKTYIDAQINAALV